MEQHTVLVPTKCGKTTCHPCQLRDVRRIGVIRCAPYCLVFGKRLRREKQATYDPQLGWLRLTARCQECLDYDASANSKVKAALVKRVEHALTVRAVLSSYLPHTSGWYRDIARAAVNEMFSPGADTRPGRV